MGCCANTIFNFLEHGFERECRRLKRIRHRAFTDSSDTLFGETNCPVFTYRSKHQLNAFHSTKIPNILAIEARSWSVRMTRGMSSSAIQLSRKFLVRVVILND